MSEFVLLFTRSGIDFAFRDPEEGDEPYPNVAFLEILSEFSFKLLQQDRAQLWEGKAHKHAHA